MMTKRSVGWLVVVPAMVLPTLGALAYFVWLEATAGAAYSAAKLMLVLYPAMAALLVRWWVGRTRGAERAGAGRAVLRDHRRSVWWGVVSGVVVGLAAWGLMWTPVGGLVLAAGPAIARKVETLGMGEHFVLFAVFISLAHSAFEEYYWRWFVFGRLRELVAPVAAHGLAALAFAAHHVVVLTQFFDLGPALAFSACVAVGGLIWSWLYARTGSLAGPWVSHALIDASLMAIGLWAMGT